MSTTSEAMNQQKDVSQKVIDVKSWCTSFVNKANFLSVVSNHFMIEKREKTQNIWKRKVKQGVLTN